MAGLAVDLGDLVGVRVLLDVGVAVVALQAAVNAGTELVAIDRDAVAGCILHRLVAVASQAICLCGQAVGHNEHSHGQKAECDGPAPSGGPEQVEQPLGWNDNDSNQERNDACGFGHATVSSSMVREQLHLRTWLPRSGNLHWFGKL